MKSCHHRSGLSLVTILVCSWMVLACRAVLEKREPASPEEHARRVETIKSRLNVQSFNNAIKEKSINALPLKEMELQKKKSQGEGQTLSCKDGQCTTSSTLLGAANNIPSPHLDAPPSSPPSFSSRPSAAATERGRDLKALLEKGRGMPIQVIEPKTEERQAKIRQLQALKQRLASDPELAEALRQRKLERGLFQEYQ
ncbi:hypothetical protein QOT17_013994 [Balamuthia mandrillaris]